LVGGLTPELTEGAYGAFNKEREKKREVFTTPREAQIRQREEIYNIINGGIIRWGLGKKSN